MITIVKPELCQVLLSLNHFGSCHREGHLNLAVRCFGYDKTTINKQIAIDSRPMKLNITEPNFTKFIPCFITGYRDAIEERDAGFSSVLDHLFHLIFLVDSYHAHDLKNFQPITGLIGYVGSTPII